MACLSFFPTKNLGACGDGGAVLTSDDSLAQRARSLRTHGAAVKYQHEEIGYNSRLDEVQSVILRVKLSRLDAWNAQRAKLAEEYDRQLAGIPLVLPKRGSDRNHIYHLYCVKTPKRDALRQYLSDRQIATALHYPVPLHLQGALKFLGGKPGDYPVSEELARQVFSLPLYPQMTLKDLHRVTDTVRKFLKTSS